MTGYMLLMLKAEPGTDSYRHAQKQVLKRLLIWESKCGLLMMS